MLWHEFSIALSESKSQVHSITVPENKMFQKQYLMAKFSSCLRNYEVNGTYYLLAVQLGAWRVLFPGTAILHVNEGTDTTNNFKKFLRQWESQWSETSF